jgi:dipeptidyl aminopeptidase/acylaminoacyl peptidase
VTSGPEPDNDGYTVIVGGTGRGTVPANGTLSISPVREGPWGVSLSGVSLNCAVDAPILKTVNVELAKSVQVSFTVRCVATVTLRVTAKTTGVDLDSDGYDVRVQFEGGSTAKGLPINGVVTIPGLAPGNYDLSLLGVAANCNPVTPSRQTVAVLANPTDVTLEVLCEKASQLAFVTTTGTNLDIHVINSNSTDDHVIASDPTADVDPAWSPDGSKIAFASRRSGNLDIYTVGADGANPVHLTVSAADDFGPAWSPDGGRIAFVSQRDGNLEIYVMNADGSNQVRLTNSVVNDVDPAWSPNGAKIALSRNNGIAVMNSDGSGLTQLTTNLRGDWQPAWSPDGTRIAFSRGISASVRDIFTMNPDGTGLAALTGGFSAQSPAWSPDGRKIAFGGVSCDAYYYYYGCSSQIMIVGLDGTVHTPLATTGASTNPSWRP